MNKDLAKKLLKTFHYPISGKSENYSIDNGFRGVFISNRDFIDEPHCSGGYFTGANDNEQEIYLEWFGIAGHENTSIALNDGYYTFSSDDHVCDYQSVIKAVKQHLRTIIES